MTTYTVVKVGIYIQFPIYVLLSFRTCWFMIIKFTLFDGCAVRSAFFHLRTIFVTFFLFDGGGCCAVDVDGTSSSRESSSGAYEGSSQSDTAS